MSVAVWLIIIKISKRGTATMFISKLNGIEQELFGQFSSTVEQEYTSKKYDFRVLKNKILKQKYEVKVWCKNLDLKLDLKIWSTS